MKARSLLPSVRNPVLELPSAQRRADMPVEAREWLYAMLMDIRADAQVRAAKSWRTHKAPMALYWKCVAVYSGHLARAVRAPIEVEAREVLEVGA